MFKAIMLVGLVTFAALIAAASPAAAMAFQPAPRNADGRMNMADPDTRGEAMTERMRQSDQSTFARPSLNGMSLVAPSRAAAGQAPGWAVPH